jgi:hypothetical protein
MAENDASRGLVDAPTKRAAEAEFKSSQQAQAPVQAPADGALSDRQIASNMLAQAERMELEARGMIAEASRMKKDAERMDPTVVASVITAPATTTVKRGRPSKAKVAADAAQ